MSRRLARLSNAPSSILSFPWQPAPNLLLPDDGGQGGHQDGGQGGTGTADGGTGTGTGTQGTGDASNAGQGNSPDGQQGQQGGQGQGEPQRVEDLPEWAQRQIRELRQENGNRRTALTAAEKQQQEIVKAFAKAAGIELPGDEGQQPDPEKLTEQLTTTQQQARDAQIELAVFKNAATHQGDPNALLDSRTFMKTVQALDPSADDFAEKVKAAIKDAVDSNPKLKAVQAATRSGAESPGGPGTGQARTPKSLTDAVSAAYSGG